MEPHMIGQLLDENYRHHSCDSELTIDIQEIFITTSVGTSRCDGLVSSNQSSGLAFTWKEEHKMTVVTFVEQKCPGEIKCPWSLTRFEKSEYVFDGSDVILKTLKQHLSEDLYRKMGDGLIAARVNLEHDQSDVRKRERHDKVQVVLTVVGSSLSVVCLTATVLTYLIFPRLRNNVGKAILSLVLSLLVAQFCQLVLWDKTKNEKFCAFVAILSHYSFLAAFFWMNILGFDLSRTFGSRSKMQAVRDSRKGFFFYSLYGWFSPLLIVGACMAIHFGKFEKLNAANESVSILQYGNNHICWITDQVALTYAFGVPIAVLLLCNAVFLADTIFGIFSARAATKRATRTNPQLLRRDGKKDFLLFCKLSYIMGITWLFGFVAAFTDMQAFHVIFILLNSTQGIFIFLAFGCNDRVIEMWRSKYTKQKLVSSKSNPHAATVNSTSWQQVNQIRIKRDQNKSSPL
ncbi:Latrophilin-like protein LAT-2 [Holothuria leucospilota]|uniref:Latrophilin-like protein LAT-2 n=1 Tax=Holothuria leucospilota TaxID=206669 RepID=A0A9Q1CHN0_HOLLE|nr:Latrophilin-like protein LAT-2 [Holothuria leucospilota]